MGRSLGALGPRLMRWPPAVVDATTVRESAILSWVPARLTALLLGVHLGRPGVYRPNADGVDCARAHTARALAWGGRAVALAATVGVLALALWGGIV